MSKARTTADQGRATGTVWPFATATAPSGYLACDGSAVSRTTYSRLFAVIGTTWGTGDGSTTFNVPDFRGAFMRGTGSHGSETMADGAAFAGPAVGAFEDDQFQGHTLSASGATNPLHRSDKATPSGGPFKFAAFDANVTAASAISSDGTNGTPRVGDETRPFAAGVLYCVKT